MIYTEIILIGSHLPIAMAALYALLVFGQLSGELRIFSFFIFLSALIQITALLLGRQGINNLPLLHVYVPAGFLCLALFYRNVLRQFVHGSIILITAIIFCIYSVFNSLLVQHVLTFNSYALTVESVLVIILSISTYIFLMNNIAGHLPGLTSSLNWINSGLFVYYASSLLLFYFGSRINSKAFPSALGRYTWMLHSFFSVIMYSCFIVGLWKRPKT